MSDFSIFRSAVTKFKKLGFCAVVSLPPTKGPVYGLDCGRPAWGDLVVEVALDEAEERKGSYEAVGTGLVRLADAVHLLFSFFILDGP